MAFITETFLNDKTLQMGREEFVRPMSIGAGWKKLRLGILFSLYQPYGLLKGNAYALGSQGNYAIGVCEGYDGFTKPTTTDAVVISPYPATTAWSLGVGYWTASLNPGKITWKYGSTESSQLTGSIGTTGPLYPTRNAWFFDLALSQRSAGATISGAVWGSTSAGVAQTDVSRTDFLTRIENENAPAQQQMTTFTLSYNGNFNLNSVCFYWPRSIPTLLVSEIAALRLY